MYFLNVPFFLSSLHSCVSLSPISYLPCGRSGSCTPETSLESPHCPCGICDVSANMHTASVQEAADGGKVAALGSNRSAESSGDARCHISPRRSSLVEPPEGFQGLSNLPGVLSGVGYEVILNVRFTNVMPVSLTEWFQKKKTKQKNFIGSSLHSMVTPMTLSSPLVE